MSLVIGANHHLDHPVDGTGVNFLFTFSIHARPFSIPLVQFGLLFVFLDEQQC